MTYIESKQKLIELIINKQAINTIFTSKAYDKTQFADFLFHEAELTGGSYNESIGMYMLRTKVHHTACPEAAAAVENLNVGDELSFKITKSFNITDKNGVSLGRVDTEFGILITSMINKGFINVEEIKVSYVKPLSQMKMKNTQPTLYVIIKLRAVDFAAELSDGCCVAMYDHDWKANATMITFLKTSVPLEIAKILFEIMDETYENDSLVDQKCNAYREMFPEDYEKALPYLKEIIREDKPWFFDNMFKLFERNAVDKSTHYWYQYKNVSCDVWEGLSMGGFYHMGSDMMLFDLEADYMDAYNKNYNYIISVSEG